MMELNELCGFLSLSSLPGLFYFHFERWRIHLHKNISELCQFFVGCMQENWEHIPSSSQNNLKSLLGICFLPSPLCSLVLLFFFLSVPSLPDPQPFWPLPHSTSPLFWELQTPDLFFIWCTSAWPQHLGANRTEKQRTVQPVGPFPFIRWLSDHLYLSVSLLFECTPWGLPLYLRWSMLLTYYVFTVNEYNLLYPCSFIMTLLSSWLLYRTSPLLSSYGGWVAGGWLWQSVLPNWDEFWSLSP